MRKTGYYADLSFQNNVSCTGCTYVVLASMAEQCMDVYDNIRESDRHDHRYMYTPSFALPISL